MTLPLTVQHFLGKEVCYARHRWNYAPTAIDWIVRKAKLNGRSVVADIGAGTGMLAAHFLGRVRQVWAIEPNADMRRMASFPMIEAYADATTLPAQSVDLITVGRALHWFPPATTKAEFARILKPRGWLAILQIACTHEKLLEAIQALKTEANGWNMELAACRQQQPPLAFYFGQEQYRRQVTPGVVVQSWEDFFGQLCSLAVAPLPSHPQFPHLEAAARAVFDRFCVNDLLTVPIATEVVLGRGVEGGCL